MDLLKCQYTKLCQTLPGEIDQHLRHRRNAYAEREADDAADILVHVCQTNKDRDVAYLVTLPVLIWTRLPRYFLK
jgi:hypothetical protein